MRNSALEEVATPLTEFSPEVRVSHVGESGLGLRDLNSQCRGQLKLRFRRLDANWVGDLIGAICLFLSFYLCLILSWVVS